MNNRIREVRTALGLSRQAFGEKLGCSGDVINNAERGRAAITDMFIQHMCSVYNVNEEWLRDGVGEMFRPITPREELAAWIAEVNKLEPNSAQRRILHLLTMLDPDDWITIDKMIDVLTKSKEE